MSPKPTQRATRNRTLTISDDDRKRLQPRIQHPSGKLRLKAIGDRTLCADAKAIMKNMPTGCIDLMIADPPYNLTKRFKDRVFSARDMEAYEDWLAGWLTDAKRLLKPDASLYVCGDWRSSAAIHRVLDRLFIVRNRITWEREKGRGAKTNWKNASEDIWFATVSKSYTFNIDSVKLRRKVLAPYTDEYGKPKDWQQEGSRSYRDTHPSNLWTDLTVPFWSMPENTDHPTQKPEKLIAKLILASSNSGDLVFDPFLGSGTTSVVARKLGRHFIGIERDESFCLLAEKRLEGAKAGDTIQGLADGVFWERNTRIPADKKG